jgi:hypothetical protein
VFAPTHPSYSLPPSHPLISTTDTPSVYQMSRYTALPGGGETSTQAEPNSARPSFSSIRRPSISSLRFGSSRQSTQNVRLPDPDEMDAAFDAPDEDETHGLLPRRQNSQPIPGEYDFERDYVRTTPSCSMLVSIVSC